MFSAIDGDCCGGRFGLLSGNRYDFELLRGRAMGWSWDQVTAMASVAGVIGGLISVYFLVLEVRRNAQALEGATVQSLMSFEKDVFALVANNAGLYLRGCAELSKLSPEEQLSFDRIVGSQMSLSYSAYVQYGQKLIDDEVWQAYANALRKYLSAPGFRVTWKAMEMSYPESFRRMIDAM